MIYPEDIEQARQQHLKFGECYRNTNHFDQYADNKSLKFKLFFSIQSAVLTLIRFLIFFFFFVLVKEDGSSLSCVLRMIKKDGSTAWVDITAEKSQESVGNSFVCNYIMIE